MQNKSEEIRYIDVLLFVVKRPKYLFLRISNIFSDTKA